MGTLLILGSIVWVWSDWSESNPNHKERELRKEDVRGCIVMVLTFRRSDMTQDDFHEERRRLWSALENWKTHFLSPMGFRYPIVMFHDGWWDRESPENQTRLKEAVGASQQDGGRSTGTLLVASMEVDRPLPEMNHHPEDFQIVNDSQGHCADRLSHRDANRILTHLMFESDVLEKFHYWLRFDPSVMLTRPVTMDPFQLMYDGGYDVGALECLGDLTCTETFYDFVRAYKVSNLIVPSSTSFFAAVESDGIMFGRAALAGRVDFFRKEVVRNLLRAFDANGGILRNQWDERHAYTAAIALYSSPDKVLTFKNHQLPLSRDNHPISSRKCPISSRGRSRRRW
uniref:Uncharacterized protein n=1 Tax=Compsopogon caeruleus TaxID=31354 RepID=A0A7S1TAD0_9RHOD